jgi:hypothetical protein
MASDAVSVFQAIGTSLTGCALLFAAISYFGTVFREARQASRGVVLTRVDGTVTIKNYDKSPIWGLVLLREGREVSIRSTYLEPGGTLPVPSIPQDIGDVKLIFRGPKGMLWRCLIDEMPVLADHQNKFLNMFKNYLGF